MEKSIKITMIVCTTIAIVTISFLAAMILLSQTAQANIGHPEKREFWLFNSNMPGFNDTKMGMPHDLYSLKVTKLGLNIISYSAISDCVTFSEERVYCDLQSFLHREIVNR